MATKDPSSTVILPEATIAHDLPRLIERMHRRFLDVVRLELTRQGINDISPVQAMMMGAIGGAEISVRDLVERGYYLGSNASYNLKTLVDQGYVDRSQSSRDKRTARLRLTEKGVSVYRAIMQMTYDLSHPLHQTSEDARSFEQAFKVLRQLERRWSDAIRDAGLDQDDRL